jgi:hypothetical protein
MYLAVFAWLEVKVCLILLAWTERRLLGDWLSLGTCMDLSDFASP